jgi:peptidoglycan/LPS O-acetylase OafA/YrhL
VEPDQAGGRLNQAAPGARLPNVILPIFILPPGAFRLCLAMAVFLNHTLPVEIGSAAVYIFFLLSGYWVFRMWQQQYRLTRRPVVTFLISRIWRLLPVYYLALAVLIGVLSIGPKPGFPWQAGLSWTALHFDISTATLLGYATLPPALRVFLPVWSLDVELQFYLVAPLVIAVLTAPRWSGARLALYALAALGLLDFIIQYGGIRAQSGFLPMYLAFFVAGVETARTGWLPTPRLALGGAAAAALLFLVCVALPQTRPLLIMGSFSGWLSHFNPDANLVLATLMAPYAAATLRQTGPFSPRIDRHLSNITYDVYLLHWSAATALLRFDGDVSAYQRLPLIALAWVIVPLVATAVYFGFDRPIDRLRARFVTRRLAGVSVTDQPYGIKPSPAPSS